MRATTCAGEFEFMAGTAGAQEPVSGANSSGQQRWMKLKTWWEEERFGSGQLW